MLPRPFRWSCLQNVYQLPDSDGGVEGQGYLSEYDLLSVALILDWLGFM